jgi:hypothetical protein
MRVKTGTRGRDGSAVEDCQGVALSGLARDKLTAFDLCTLTPKLAHRPANVKVIAPVHSLTDASCYYTWLDYLLLLHVNPTWERVTDSGNEDLPSTEKNLTKIQSSRQRGYFRPETTILHLNALGFR